MNILVLVNLRDKVCVMVEVLSTIQSTSCYLYCTDDESAKAADNHKTSFWGIRDSGAINVVQLAQW